MKMLDGKRLTAEFTRISTEREEKISPRLLGETSVRSVVDFCAAYNQL
jgi:hypothetical protein